MQVKLHFSTAKTCSLKSNRFKVVTQGYFFYMIKLLFLHILTNLELNLLMLHRRFNFYRTNSSIQLVFQFSLE